MRRPTSDARQREKRRPSLDSSGHRRRNCSAPFQTIWPDRVIPSLDSETDFLCDRAVEFMESGDIHSVVSVELAEHSMYFERLLCYHKGRGHIRLPEFLNPGFSSVLEYIRNGSTELTATNVYNIFIAADFLLVSNLKADCASFMKKMASDPSTAISLWLTCRDLHWPEVANMAFEKLLENFEIIWNSPEFLELEPMDLWVLLQEDRLNCKREKNVLEAVHKWVNHSINQRLRYATDLLLCGRLGMMTASEIESTRGSDLVHLLPDYLNLLNGWPKSLRNSTDPLVAACGTQVFSPRVPHEVVIVFGGWCDGEGPRAAAQVYNPRANTWTLWSETGPLTQAMQYDWLDNPGQIDQSTEPMPLISDQDAAANSLDDQTPLDNETSLELETTRHNLLPDGPICASDFEMSSKLIGEIPRRVYAGCVLVGRRVYLVGGFDGSNALKSTLCYDFEIDSGWYEISCMYEKRYYVSVAYSDGYIYAIGGHNGENQGRLDSAERYNMEENLWQTIASMNRIRSDAAAAELGGRVYIAGGFEGRRYHDSAEYYEPEANQWTLISRMHSPRGGISLAQHGGYLYAIGGNDGNSRLKSIERYDPVEAKWEIIGQMNRRKSNLSSAVLNDDIYIIGGWSDEQESGILELVERFDVVKRECHVVRPLSFPASATCACTLKDRDLVAKYVRPIPNASTRSIAPIFADFTKQPENFIDVPEEGNRPIESTNRLDLDDSDNNCSQSNNNFCITGQWDISKQTQVNPVQSHCKIDQHEHSITITTNSRQSPGARASPTFLSVRGPGGEISDKYELLVLGRSRGDIHLLSPDNEIDVNLSNATDSEGQTRKTERWMISGRRNPTRSERLRSPWYCRNNKHIKLKEDE